MHIYKHEVAEALSDHIEMPAEKIRSLLTAVPPDMPGDISLPCFALAKIMKRSPAAIAGDLVGRISIPFHFSEVRAIGPYINFVADPEKVANDVLGRLNMEEGGILSNPPTGFTYVLDYSSPNAAKPFSIGHLRSTVIGHSLKKILEYLGNDAIGINHLGDWGTGFGKLLVAYRKWGNQELLAIGVRYLLDLYVQFHQASKDNPELEEEARKAFADLEKGDAEARQLWRKILDISWKEISRIYDRLDVSFEHVTGESFYEPMLKPLVDTLVQRGICRESEGALIIPMPDNMPPLLLVKSDGSTLYATRDLAAALYRQDTFNAHKLLYIVGSEQKLHFQQLAQALGIIEPSISMEHVDFGLYRFADKRLSTRKGHVIFMDEVLERAVEMTRKIILEKNPDLENADEVAEKVGTGAIVFGDLYNDRIKTVDFDWNRMLDFNGETGPYVQYSYARICGILRKADAWPPLKGSPLQQISEGRNGINRAGRYLQEPETRELIRLMADLPGSAHRAAESFKPSVMARYAIELARAISRFYQAHQVLKAEPVIRESRLQLLEGARACLGCTMDLLGLARLERM